MKDMNNSAKSTEVKTFGKKGQPIVSVAFDKYNYVITLSLNGEINHIDIRMEQILKTYEEETIME